MHLKYELYKQIKDDYISLFSGHAGLHPHPPTPQRKVKEQELNSGCFPILLHMDSKPQ